MAGVSGPGGTGGAGFRPETGVVTPEDELKEQQALQALKDVNSKTQELRTGQKGERDAFASKQSNTFAVEKDASAASREKVLSATLPEALTIIEGAFDVELNAAKLFKMQNKVQAEPGYKDAAREMRTHVEEWSKQALQALENRPAVIEMPKVTLPALPKVEPPKVELRPEATKPVVVDEGSQKLKVETAKPELPKNDIPLSEQALKGASFEDVSLKNSALKDTTLTDPALNTPKLAADEMRTPFDDAAQRIVDAMFSMPADPTAPGVVLTPEQKFLLTIAEPTKYEPVKPGEEPRFDEHGTEIADAEHFHKATLAFERFGPSTLMNATYNTLLFELSKPVQLDVLPSDGEVALKLEVDLDGTDASDVTPEGGPDMPPLPNPFPPAPPLPPVAGGGGSGGEGAQMLSGIGGAGGSSSGSTLVSNAGPASPMDALMNGGDVDITVYAMIILMDCLKSLNEDIKLAMKWAQVRHKMNNAMRAQLAEVMQKMGGLKRPKDGETMPEGVFIENRTPMVVYGDDGQPTGEVRMEPQEVETPYSTQTPDSNGSNTPKPISAEGQVAQIKGLEQSANPPITSKTRGPENGTIFVTSTHSYVTCDHVDIVKERLKNQIQQLKMDLSKEMLSVQKFVGIRKNVFDNLNKMVKSKSEEWGKSIALLRR